MEGVTGPHPRAKFHRCHFKMWAYSPKIAKIGNFWYKFSPKGYTPLSDFYNSWLGEGVTGPHSAPHAKFHRCGFKNVGLQPPKLAKKMVIFGINLPIVKNSGSL